MRKISQVLRRFLRWAYHQGSVLPVVADAAIWIVGLALGAALQTVFDTGGSLLALTLTAVSAAALHTLLGYGTGLYRQRWRVSSFDEVVGLSAVWGVTAVFVITGTYVARQLCSQLATSAVITGAMSTLCLLGLERGLWRRFWELNQRPSPDSSRRTIVFGAGDGGAQIIRAMLLDPDSEYFPLALLDDDRSKQNRELEGVRVRGTRENMGSVAERVRAEVLLIAIPSANASLIKELSQLAMDADLAVRVLPSTSELVGQMALSDVRAPTVDDLLGRDPVEIDVAAVADYLRGKRVLISGAGGSIGSELARQVQSFGPEELFLLDRDESALHGLQLLMEGRALLESKNLLVADIRDRDRIFEVFADVRPEVVFHAAALKHLTLLENNPSEGLKTNVWGTKNLIDAACVNGTTRFVNISTDKAADPTSVLGATKLAAERLTAKAAIEHQRNFLSVRFGNVLGSRGSVLPTFLEQIRQGRSVTVTDPEVTRFFMTVSEAVRLVIQAGAIGKPSEVLLSLIHI